MEKTKKEHYVPQCYLRNFKIPGTEGKINVFDKQKEQIRLNQNILDNASERYFYDIDIDKMLSECSEDQRNKMLEQLGQKYEVYRDNNEQHLERFFSEIIEGDYSETLKSIISKVESATPWYVKNCYSMSIAEKVVMSVCITFQFLRTKKQRVMIEEGITKLYKTIIPKLYNIEFEEIEEKIGPEDIDVNIGKEAMKLEHAKFILDIENIMEFTQIFLGHIWVIYINRTNIPFWTSDAPIGMNPMKDGWRCGRGIASRGIEIILPLSDKVALGMYDREFYTDKFSMVTNLDDRIYIELKNEKRIQEFNQLQVRESYRCLYSSSEDFTIAQKMCKKYPYLTAEEEYFSVG